MPCRARRWPLLALAFPLALTACAARPPAVPTVASDEPAGRPSLTIYSSADPTDFFAVHASAAEGRTSIPGFAMLRETRKVPLVAGRNRVELTRVADGVDPTTVSFRSITDRAGTTVVERSLSNDLTSAGGLLNRLVGRDVVLVVAGKDNEPTDLPCTLLALPDDGGDDKSARAAYVVRTGGPTGPVSLRQATSVRAIRLPEGRGGAVVTRPTVNLLVDAKRAGPHDVELEYQAGGLAWCADYDLLLSPDGKSAEASAWVSIVNASGLAFEDATVKLLAGKVKVIPRTGQGGWSGGGGVGRGSLNYDEQPFADYHLFAMTRTVSLPDRTTKQVELFPARPNVAVERAYLWTGPRPAHVDEAVPATAAELAEGEPGDVNVSLRLANTAAGGLGMPLPAGRVRVYKADPADGTRQFVGEDVIDHTPAGKSFDLSIGIAFDVVGSRAQKAFAVDGKTATETFEVSIRNRKAEPAKVTVREYAYRWKNWALTESSQKPTATGPRSVDFAVDLAAGEEKKVTYTVKYTW